MQDEWIPFYQIVFKGYISMSSASLTFSDNAEDDLLKAVSCGIGLLFNMNGSETADLISSPYKEVSAKSYDDTEPFIRRTFDRAKDTLYAVSGAAITRFYKPLKQVSVTEFDNGRKIIVNYSDASYSYGETVIEGKSFLLV